MTLLSQGDAPGDQADVAGGGVTLALVPETAPAPELVPDPALGPSSAQRRLDGFARRPQARPWWAVLVALAAATVIVRTVVVHRDRDAARHEQVAAASERASTARTRAAVQATVDEITAQLGRDRAALADTATALGDRQEARERLDASIGELRREVDARGAELAARQHGAAIQLDQTQTLRACLGTLDTARRLITANLPAEAVDALRIGGDSCRRAQGVIDGTGATADFAYDFPDPYVLVADDGVYAYGTNGPGGRVQVLRSTGLTGWELVGEALAALAPWAQEGRVWAPAVQQVGAAFVLYYSVTESSSGLQCVSVAVASRPQGPYTDASTGPLVCQRNLGGSIDASPVTAPDGSRYLVWKSDGNALVGAVTHLWGQRLDAAGTAVVDEPVRLLSADQAWEGGIIEGPSLLHTGGYWVLLYSANRWDTAAYATGQALCDSPLGPCRKITDPIVLASGADLAGPGGTELFADRHGGLHVAFHAWSPGAVGNGNPRRLSVADALIGADGRLTILR